MKYIRLFFILSIVFLALLSSSHAEMDLAPPTAPTLSIKGLKEGFSIGKVPNSEDQYYVDLEWQAMIPGGAVAGYVNIYMLEEVRGNRPQPPKILKERALPATKGAHRINGLSSGRVYHFEATAYYTASENGIMYNSPESNSSNTVKAFTEISLKSSSFSQNQVTLTWDDAWFKGDRIDYRLYVSETANFNNVAPITIDHRVHIGADKPVTVNDVTSRLEYTLDMKDAGRIYYIRIFADVVDPILKLNPLSNTIETSTNIFVKASRLSQISSGVVWKLEWSPVVTGLNDPEIKISYDIYKVNIVSTDLPKRIATIQDTNLPIIVPEGETGFYYQIEAKLLKDNQNISDLKIKSDRIFFNDEISSAEPQVPELLDQISNPDGEVIIDTKTSLTSRTAVVLWRAPIREDGIPDPSVRYDMWLITDPNTIDNPLSNQKIASDFQIARANYIEYNNKILGFKHELKNLVPNTTYYFKIIAKRTRTEYVENKLTNIDYPSLPALRVIITPFIGAMDRPVPPAKPPFGIKKDLEGQEMITQNSITLTFKNLWYEKRNTQTGAWEYVRTEKNFMDDIPEYIPTPETLDDLQYRKIEYDPDIKLDIAYVPYFDGMVIDQMTDESAYRMKGMTITPNDPSEDSRFNVDKKSHNVNINLLNLQPNTMYIIWIRTFRESNYLYSDPSAAIIVTTKPNVIPAIEKPAVPSFNYSYVVDTYVDLGWPLQSNYNYYLRYNTKDDFESATTASKITYQQLLNNPYYRINSLIPNTMYFFWLQMESKDILGSSITSEWSDSYSVTTASKQLPSAPLGFGIMQEEGSITSSSLSFEWTKSPLVSYILEIADNAEFKNKQTIPIAVKNTHKVEKLKANTRYYARLYSVDLNTNEKSRPTDTLSIRTDKSGEEFDTNENNEISIFGPIVEKEINKKDKSFSVKITGDIAERFIQSVLHDKAFDFTLDLKQETNAVKTGKIIFSKSVLDSMNAGKENIVIHTTNIDILLLPDSLSRFNDVRQFGSLQNPNIELHISELDKKDFTASNVEFKSEITKLQLRANDGRNSMEVKEMNQPILLQFSFNQPEWFTNNSTSILKFKEDEMTWIPVKTTVHYDEMRGRGYVQAKVFETGIYAVGDFTPNYLNDIKFSEFEESVKHVLETYPLSSFTKETLNLMQSITIGDAMQIFYEIVQVPMDKQVIVSARRSGIIDSIRRIQDELTQIEALRLFSKLYEAKVGQTTTNDQERYDFAIQNGWFYEDEYTPLEPINQGLFMYMLEQVLKSAGEIK